MLLMKKLFSFKKTILGKLLVIILIFISILNLFRLISDSSMYYIGYSGIYIEKIVLNNVFGHNYEIIHPDSPRLSHPGQGTPHRDNDPVAAQLGISLFLTGFLYYYLGYFIEKIILFIYKKLRIET